jgi:16S rRNA processing protein RimM
VIKYIEFGKVLSVHGLKGEVLLQCFFDNVDHFLEKGIYIRKDDVFELINLTQTGIKKNGIIVKLSDCNTKEEALYLINKIFFVTREALEQLNDENENTHFVADLLDLQVFFENDDEIFGTVRDVLDFGGGPLLEVELNLKHKKNITKKEKFEYYEKNIHNIKEINIKQGYLILKLND